MFSPLRTVTSFGVMVNSGGPTKPRQSFLAKKEQIERTYDLKTKTSLIYLYKQRGLNCLTQYSSTCHDFEGLHYCHVTRHAKVKPYTFHNLKPVD